MEITALLLTPLTQTVAKQVLSPNVLSDPHQIEVGQRELLTKELATSQIPTRDRGPVSGSQLFAVLRQAFNTQDPQLANDLLSGLDYHETMALAAETSRRLGMPLPEVVASLFPEQADRSLDIPSSREVLSRLFESARREDPALYRVVNAEGHPYKNQYESLIAASNRFARYVMISNDRTPDSELLEAERINAQEGVAQAAWAVKDVLTRQKNSKRWENALVDADASLRRLNLALDHGQWTDQDLRQMQIAVEEVRECAHSELETEAQSRVRSAASSGDRAEKLEANRRYAELMDEFVQARTDRVPFENAHDQDLRLLISEGRSRAWRDAEARVEAAHAKYEGLDQYLSEFTSDASKYFYLSYRTSRLARGYADNFTDFFFSYVKEPYFRMRSHQVFDKTADRLIDALGLPGNRKYGVYFEQGESWIGAKVTGGDLPIYLVVDRHGKLIDCTTSYEKSCLGVCSRIRRMDYGSILLGE